MVQIPNTLLSVSEVCFGTMNFGNPVGPELAAELLRYGRERGINFVDTANMYEGYNRYLGSAGGTSEQYIGQALKGVRQDYVLATKVGMKVGEGPEDEFTSPAAIRKYTRRSLQNLQTDHIDILYLHKYDPVTPPEEILGALAQEIQAGNIRYYGVSNYTAEQLEALLKAADTNHLPRPVITQPPLSLLKQDVLADFLPLCAKENLASVPYQVLQGGLLTGKYRRGAAAPAGSRVGDGKWLHDIDAATYDQLEAFEKAAADSGLSMTHYALRWALQQPSVLSVLVGFRSLAQIDDAAALLH